MDGFSRVASRAVLASVFSIVLPFALTVSLVALAVASPVPAGAADAASETAAGKAVAWLATQQQPDGGFEIAGFPGFETPDAVLAIAEAAQTGSTWNPAAGLAAVQALHAGGPGGPTPLDALDALADAGITGGQAAKLIDLVVAPLGLDAADFDPSDNSAAPVDLLTMLDPAGCSGDPASYGLFNQTMYGALAKRLLCGAANPAVISTIRTAQRPDGGWNFLGDQSAGTESDVDTTSLGIQSLIAGGAANDDPAVLKALGFLAAQHRASGAWAAFGADDPNSTAVGIVAVEAAGFDATKPCWRDTAAPNLTGTAYGDPVGYLRSQQQADGRIASPNDSFGVNTFATSQTVEGLLRSWLPITSAAGAPTCVQVADTPPVSLPTATVAAAVGVAPSFTG